MPHRRLQARPAGPRHLLISAARAAEGGGPLSDAIGVYKEVSDSRGGSGFSFNDLAADRAGTRLGLRARRDAVVVFFLGFFLVLTNFLYSQSLLTAAAMLVALMGLLTALVLAGTAVALGAGGGTLGHEV